MFQYDDYEHGFTVEWKDTTFIFIGVDQKFSLMMSEKQLGDFKRFLKFTLDDAFRGGSSEDENYPTLEFKSKSDGDRFISISSNNFFFEFRINEHDLPALIKDIDDPDAQSWRA